MGVAKGIMIYQRDLDRKELWRWGERKGRKQK